MVAVAVGERLEGGDEEARELPLKVAKEWRVHWSLLASGALGTLLCGVLIGAGGASQSLPGFFPLPGRVAQTGTAAPQFGLWLPDAECLEAEEKAEDLGPQRALRECAAACAARAGCAYFSYGGAGKGCRREPLAACAARRHRRRSGHDVFAMDSGVGLAFRESRAIDALGELTATEVREVAAWFMKETGTAANRASADTEKWLAGPAAVELLRPKKSATLAYLDGKGPRPERHARVAVVGKGYVAEYKVGPLSASGRPEEGAKIETLVPPGSVPYTKRPTEIMGDEPFLNASIKTALRAMGAPVLTELFGKIFVDLADEGGFDPKGPGFAFMQTKNDALSPKGVRRIKLNWLWQPKVGAGAMYVHPIPLYWEMDVTSPNVSEWFPLHFIVCHQGPFRSAQDFRRAFEAGRVKRCKTNFSSTNGWDVPQAESAPVPFAEAEKQGGVEWGPWSFAVTQRMSTGPALFDVRFRGERILYELSMQDAQAAYAGDGRSQFFYSDGAWSLSMMSKSLVPGVDCPSNAHYLSFANWLYWVGPRPDPTKAADFFPVCVFEWLEDHTIWRHMDGERVRGLTRKTVVVRSVATVGNYDYITDIKLREDGEIHVETRFAGYIESRHFDAAVNPGEEKFSSIVRPDLAGTVHCHLVAFKADFDIAGVRENALHVTEVKAHPSEGLGVNWLKDESEPSFWSKVLEHRYVEREGANRSTFVSSARLPSSWSIVDRHSAHAEHMSPRGFAVQLASASAVQVLPHDHPFVLAMPYTKYHLAVTKYHDEEYRVNSGYVHFDGQVPWRGQGAQDLDVFLGDNESLLDQDLVAWIGFGKEHIVRQEDLPLVSNFGGGFSLVPWNFLPGNAASNPPK